MPTLEDERKQAENGPSGWRDRLGKEIELMSPDGDQYFAKWKGDQRSVEKKVGIFSFPGLNGAIVQDLAAQAARYPLTLYFDGPNNDLISSAFFESIKQSGRWTVEHPLYGFIELQPLSVTVEDKPVDSGNITEILSEWIEPLDETTLQTARQLWGVIDQLIIDLNVASAQSFINESEVGNFGDQAATTDTIGRQAAAAGDRLADMAAGDDDIAGAWEAARDGLDEALAETEIDPALVAGYQQNVLQKPAAGISDLDERLDAYEDLIDDIEALLPDDQPSSKNRNKAIAGELGFSGALGAVGTVVTTGTLDTREHAVKTAERLIDLLDQIVNALDTIQEYFESSNWDERYFSQTNTYTEAAGLVAKAVQYLLISSYDLKVEKRFKLKEPSTPVMIVLSEYKTLGENETYLTQFIGANQLTNFGTLWLAAGTEIVVYV